MPEIKTANEPPVEIAIHVIIVPGNINRNPKVNIFAYARRAVVVEVVVVVVVESTATGAAAEDIVDEVLA